MNAKTISNVYLFISSAILLLTIFFAVPEANGSCWNCYGQFDTCDVSTNCGMTACSNPGCQLFGSYCDVQPNCGQGLPGEEG